MFAGFRPQFLDEFEFTFDAVAVAPFDVGFEEVEAVLGVIRREFGGPQQVFRGVTATTDTNPGRGVAVKQTQVAIWSAEIKFFVELSRELEFGFHLID